MGFMTGKRHPARNNLGQISIVAASLMATTFFLFFAFVVNTGMLVHAKINLQNAADVAAFAGAATQARQLEKIGMLNYDLRRQYKKFLYRYYVIGNLSRPQYGSGGGGANAWGSYTSTQNGGTKQFIDFNVPAVCLVFKPGDNYCNVFNLQEISTGGQPSFLDPIGQALKEVLQNIEQIRQSNCSGISYANVIALYLWLYNTDPRGSQSLISQNYQDSESRLAFETLPAVTQGLGVVPKNLLTHQRITILAKWVNEPGQTNLRTDQLASLEQSPVPMKYERAVLAFKSAQRTLGPSIFDSETLTMRELLPAGGTPLLKLDTITPSFTVFATHIAKVGGSTECKQNLFPINIPKLPVAVMKDPQVPTYYAVRLQAEPRLLFNPFNIKLEAYSAAKPFGSRLGPNGATEAVFLRKAKPSPAVSLTAGTVARFDAVPNLPLNAEDRSNDDLGFNNEKVFSSLKREISGSSGNNIAANRLIQVEGTATLPNQAEFGDYIIPSDIHETNGRPIYNDYFNGGTSLTTAFYAPLSDSPAADAENTIRTTIESVPNSAETAGLRRVLLQGLGTYFTSLRQGQGENGEGLEVARTLDPAKDATGDLARDLLGVKLKPEQIRSSFGGANLGPFHPSGKIGYSVKFVSIRSLFGTGSTSGDSELEGVSSAIDH